MFKIFGTFRKFSNLALSEPNIYSDNIIVYNKLQKYFTEYTKTYYDNGKEEHILLNSSSSICNVCKGAGIIFNNKSTIDFNYYKLCDNCNGKGYLP